MDEWEDTYCGCVCGFILYIFLPDRYRGKGFLVYVGQFVHDHSSGSKDPVRVEEGVEEVDGEEAQVRQPFQQPLHAGVADLGDLAGVERLAEADVHIIFVQPCVRPGGTRMNKIVSHWVISQRGRRELDNLGIMNPHWCRKGGKNYLNFIWALTWSCAAQWLLSFPQTHWSSGHYSGYYLYTIDREKEKGTERTKDREKREKERQSCYCPWCWTSFKISVEVCRSSRCRSWFGTGHLIPRYVYLTDVTGPGSFLLARGSQ